MLRYGVRAGGAEEGKDEKDKRGEGLKKKKEEEGKSGGGDVFVKRRNIARQPVASALPSNTHRSFISIYLDYTIHFCT